MDVFVCMCVFVIVCAVNLCLCGVFVIYCVLLYVFVSFVVVLLFSLLCVQLCVKLYYLMIGCVFVSVCACFDMCLPNVLLFDLVEEIR